jgi:hypothetical protein
MHFLEIACKIGLASDGFGAPNAVLRLEAAGSADKRKGLPGFKYQVALFAKELSAAETSFA